MKTFFILIREPKPRHGFHITKAIVVAEGSLEAMRVVKEQFVGIQADAIVEWREIDPHKFTVLSRG